MENKKKFIKIFFLIVKDEIFPVIFGLYCWFVWGLNQWVDDNYRLNNGHYNKKEIK